MVQLGEDLTTFCHLPWVEMPVWAAYGPSSLETSPVKGIVMLMDLCRYMLHVLTGRPIVVIRKSPCSYPG